MSNWESNPIQHLIVNPSGEGGCYPFVVLAWAITKQIHNGPHPKGHVTLLHFRDVNVQLMPILKNTSLKAH